MLHITKCRVNVFLLMILKITTIFTWRLWYICYEYRQHKFSMKMLFRPFYVLHNLIRHFFLLLAFIHFHCKIFYLIFSSSYCPPEQGLGVSLFGHQDKSSLQCSWGFQLFSSLVLPICIMIICALLNYGNVQLTTYVIILQPFTHRTTFDHS